MRETSKEYYTHWKRPLEVPEINDGKVITERAGYMPTNKIIENMMLAGKNLVAWRESQFDYASPKDDDGLIDPTRNPGYDYSDAYIDLINAENELEAAQLRADLAKKAAEEAEKAAAEAAKTTANAEE